MQSSRRFFLKQSTVSLAGLALMPAWIAACKKNYVSDQKSFTGKVVIVGAGIAGIYAAYILKNQGADVVVLEAANRYGGRIKPLTDFATFTIELGAEEIHGEKSVFYDLIKAGNHSFITDVLNHLYYFNGSLKTEAQATENTFFNIVDELTNGLSDYAGSDITAEAFAGSEGVSDNVKHFFNAWIGNENGTDIGRIGMHGLRETDQRWTAGDNNFMLKDSDILSIIEQQFQEIIPLIRLEKQVTEIDYSTSSVKVICADDDIVTADKVIVTVPLSIMQSNDISFVPALPDSKVAAYNRIGIDRGLKVIIKFDVMVWPANTGSIYGEGYVPEFWVTSGGGRSDSEFILTAFIMGENAEYLTAQGDQMITTILAELDVIFGNASTHYVDHVIQDWGNEPHIRGAYSYPKVGTGNAREIIASPVGNNLFFAGEATHTQGHAGTVHGAMETALRAALEIINA